MLSDLIAPRLIGSSVDVVAKKKQLARELKASTPRAHTGKAEKLPDDIRLEMHDQDLVPTTPPIQEDETVEQYTGRVAAGNAEITTRLRALIQTEEYKTASKEERQAAIKAIIKDSRADTTRNADEETEIERNLRVAASAEQDRVRQALLARGDYQSLSEEGQEVARRALSDLFRAFSASPAAKKLSHQQRNDRAQRGLAILQSWIDKKLFERRLQMVILKAQRKAHP
jgi:hypothetical protein